MIGIATELLDLVARWVHVIAGIMWVGNSLLFNWLDRNLASTPEHYGGTGAIWLLHSGGFYYVEKTLLPGQKLPVPLHWFKWQAYTTWLSGVALLIAVYWGGGRAVMADPAIRNLTHREATIVGIGSIIAASLIYEVANRLIARRAPTLAMGIWIGAFSAIAYGLTVTLSGRAAFLHVGAMLGTVMAGNVFFTIVPSQRALVQSVASGEQHAAVAGSGRAKRVSIHNNYITFPVLVLMVTSHFPGLYAGEFRFASLMVLIAGGVLARHALNIRFTSRRGAPLLAASIVGTIVSLAALSVQRPIADLTQPAPGPVDFADVEQVIERRCVVCHSVQPADRTFGPAPGGAAFDTPAQIATLANRIHERAVVTRTMPPANKTNITDAERALIARWFIGGALTR